MIALPVLVVLVVLIAVAVVIAVVAIILKSPSGKGRFGEGMVGFALRRRLDSATYHVLNDVTLPTRDGRTSQIDHVIVSPFGIFVVETKNMGGWIFGKESEKTWTQKFRGQSHQFLNPVRQNSGHVWALEETLGLSKAVFKPLVVFGPDATLKKAMPENVMTGGYVTYVKQHTKRILSDDQVAAAVARIEERRLPRGRETDREHIRYVESVKAEKGLAGRKIRAPRPLPPNARASESTASASAPPPVLVPPTAPSCPLCGSLMVVRTARRGPNKGGKFWGCSTYPKCGAIVQIKDEPLH